MKLKNRKASALFSLVMFFSVLILMSTGVLALTNMAAQSRALERRRKAALYESEAAYALLDAELQNAFLDPVDGIYVLSLQAANTAAGEYTELLRLLLKRKWDMAENDRLNSSSGTNPDVSAMAGYNTELLAYLTQNAYSRGNPAGGGEKASDIYSLEYHLFQYLSNSNGGPAADLTSQLSALKSELEPELTNPTLFTCEDGSAINLGTVSGIADFMGSRAKFREVETEIQGKAEGLYIEMFDREANAYVSGTLADAEALKTKLGAANLGETSLVMDAAAVPLFSGTTAASIPLTFRSEKPQSDGRTARITAEYVLARPGFQNQSLYTILGNVNVNTNILQQKALSAQNGIYLEPDAVVEITGDVFAGGVNGGLSLYNNSSFTLRSGADKDEVIFATAGDIKNAGDGVTLNMGSAEPDSANPALLTDQAKVYARNLEAAASNETTRYNINGALYTYGSLILDGSNSQVAIDGNYYGFFPGGGEKGYNTGSRIVINDIEDGSHLRITGEEVLIAGTAYIEGLKNIIDPEDPNSKKGLLPNESGLASQPGYYQTGESVAIKGNYSAYGLPIRQSTLTRLKTAWGLDAGADNYRAGNINFKEFEPLFAAYSFKTKGTETDSPLNGMEKALYFAIAAEEYAALNSADDSLFPDGGLINMDSITIEADEIWTTGIAISGSTAAGRDIVRSSQADVITRWSAAQDDYKLQVNGLGTSRDYRQNPGDTSTDRDGALLAKALENGSFPADAPTPADLARYSSYAAENKIIFAGEGGTVTIQAGTPAGVRAVSGGYTITVDGGFAHIILLHAGDVVIKDGLTLVGSIISGGRVTMEGSSRLYADAATAAHGGAAINNANIIELLAIDKFDRLTQERVADADADTADGPIAKFFNQEGLIENYPVYRRIGVDSYYRPPDVENIIRLTAWE